MLIELSTKRDADARKQFGLSFDLSQALLVPKRVEWENKNYASLASDGEAVHAVANQRA